MTHSNILKTVLSSIAIALGAFLVVFGEMDDSPGAQLLGLILTATGVYFVVRAMWRKKAPDANH